MREDHPPLTREQRLAAKLRENLRRRKDQARAAPSAEQDSRLPKAEPDS